MLDVIFAGVTGLVLAVLLSRPPKPASPRKDARATSATPEPAATAARGPRAKSKWD